MKLLQFQLDLTFFGLTSNFAAQFKKNIYDQIHEICFWGQGGFTWNEVYAMPIWVRKYTFHKLKKYHEEKSTPSQDGKTTTLVGEDGKVNTPAFLNASKKYKKTSYK